MPHEWPTMLVTAILAMVIVSCLIAKRKALRGTTLQAPWCWSLMAVLSIAAAGIATVMFSIVHVEAWQFVAAAAAFCPQMALLGAKRPQNRAWQFVVLTLWLILILPAVEASVLRPGQTLDVRGIRSWFLMLLIVVGVATSLPTRFWLSGLFVAAGQTLLIWPQLPWGSGNTLSAGTPLAMAAFLLAVFGAMFPLWKSRPADHPLDRVWIDFRDWFGALWGLRIMERINAVGAMYDWPFTLTWKGFRSRDESSGETPDAELEVLKAAFTNLLRRFVSAEWIAKRMDEAIDCKGP